MLIISRTGNAEKKDVVRPPFRIKVPDALACEPPAQRKFGGRNHIHPRYIGLIVEPTAITKGTTTATWGKARIVSTPNEQCVSFHLTQSSYSSFSPKTGRLDSGLGPHERSWGMELAVDPRWVDYELQGATVMLGDDPGDPDNSYRTDWIGVDWDNRVHSGEIKAHNSHYLDPDYSKKLTAAGQAFAAIDVRFRRSTGDEQRKNARRMLNVSNAYGDAFTFVSEDQVAAIADTIRDDGGTTTIGRLEDAIGGGTLAARSILQAALCRRLVSYDLDRRVDCDTAVTVPRTPAFIVDIRAIDTTVTL